MRIVIGGEDEVAFGLAEALMGEHSVVLVCPESAAAPRIDRLDIETVYGSATASEVLHRSGAHKADIFVACTPYDEQNLVACVLAKQLGARRTVCFLFRPDFRTALDESKVFAASIGIDSIVRPPEQLAREVIRIATVPGALEVEVFEGGKVRLFRHAIEETAPITRAPLRDLGLPSDVVLVMARRGEESFVPRGDTRLLAGDQVTAMGNPRGMNRLLHKFLRNDSHGREPHSATVVGAGEVGLAVSLGLEDLGWKVKVIERDAKRCEEITRVFNSLVLHGDGTDLDLLEAERIADDSVLIAVTSNDEKNLLVSLLAKHLGVPRIITRADNPNNERLFEKVGVDVVLSAQGAAIQAVVAGAVASRAERLAELEHGDAVVLELALPEELRPVSLEALAAPKSAIIGAVLRGSDVIIPRGKDVLRGTDRVLVFCTREDEEEVRDFFHHRVLREAR
jgi:trk system potassium uptake protein TrkA